MDDKLCFVQFLHPGTEHRAPKSVEMDWNVGDHRRKFLVSNGTVQGNGPSRSGKLVFWGEWEPQSRVRHRYSSPGPGEPRYLHEPFCRPVDGWAQNTDPFVFGDQFHYTGCQQHRGGFPTQLRHLSRGSVILFGSYKSGGFTLDTVFVVSDHQDHHAHNVTDLRDQVSDLYWQAVLVPWYRGQLGIDQSNRLYFGATPEAAVDGMFSFVPCKPLQDAPHGFVRPTISLPGVITDNHKQSYKKNEQAELSAVRILWDRVVEQVHQQGLLLGTNLASPPLTAP
jgi:hypothetical protein